MESQNANTVRDRQANEAHISKPASLDPSLTQGQRIENPQQDSALPYGQRFGESSQEVTRDEATVHKDADTDKPSLTQRIGEKTSDVVESITTGAAKAWDATKEAAHHMKEKMSSKKEDKEDKDKLTKSDISSKDMEANRYDNDYTTAATTKEPQTNFLEQRDAQGYTPTQLLAKESSNVMESATAGIARAWDNTIGKATDTHSAHPDAFTSRTEADRMGTQPAFDSSNTGTNPSFEQIRPDHKASDNAFSSERLDDKATFNSGNAAGANPSFAQIRPDFQPSDDAFSSEAPADRKF